MSPDRPATDDVVRAVSFDLFGTLVEVRPPANPAEAVATALRERDVAVPDDWQTRYESSHLETAPGVERSLYDHVEAALVDGTDRGEQHVSRHAIEAAVDATFDPDVETVSGAEAVVRTVGKRVPVAVLSNSSVPGLVERAIDRSALALDDFDAVVASVDCGWRKPDSRAFETVADALGVDVDELLHVGDDPETDGGITAAGGEFVSVQETSLESIPAMVGRRP